MKIQIKYLKSIVAATLLFAAGYGNSQAQSAEINFVPAEIEAQVGEPFFVEVSFDTDNTPISVFDLHMLFDANYLEVLSIETLQGDLFNYHQPPAYDNTNGKMDMAAFQIGKTIPGTFSVIKIELQPLAAVELTEIVQNMTSFPKTLMAYGGENMLGETGNLKVTITDSSVGLSDKVFTDEFKLEVWPNPTNDIANISFIVKDSEQLELALFDEGGKLVKQLYSGTAAPGAEKKIRVDMSNFASGIYTCRLISKDKVQSTKLNLVK